MNLETLKAMAKSGDNRVLIIKWVGAPHDEYTTAKRILEDIAHGFYTEEHFNRSATVEVARL
jgi:hypothetical protein